MQVKVPPCPLCRSNDIQLLDDVNPAKRACKCRGCGCTAPATSWAYQVNKPWQVVGYVGYDLKGEQHFTEKRTVAGAWYDSGWKVTAVSERIK